MTQYPMDMVQKLVCYLYTGMMEKPQGKEWELLQQLLDEYGLVPHYADTLQNTPSSESLDGEIHNDVSNNDEVVNSECTNEIKEENITTSDSADNSISYIDNDMIEDDNIVEDESMSEIDEVDNVNNVNNNDDFDDNQTDVMMRTKADSKTYSNFNVHKETQNVFKTDLNVGGKSEIKKEIDVEQTIDEHLQNEASDTQQTHKKRKLEDGDTEGSSSNSNYVNQQLDMISLLRKCSGRPRGPAKIHPNLLAKRIKPPNTDKGNILRPSNESLNFDLQIETSEDKKAELTSDKILGNREDTPEHTAVLDHIEGTFKTIEESKNIADHDDETKKTSAEDTRDEGEDDWMIEMEKEFVKYRERHECEVCQNGFPTSSQEIDHFYEVLYRFSLLK